ncbi:MAG: hypothetical protein EXX96DRAFT_553407 [Benjaminiella poitrasii]|nr:MAG: hypothetical protein EXX96DRAFT_553407 [Benjaminiella poitrasii]
MTRCFVLLGRNDRKIYLENATHPCPRCKKSNTVQLTRFENELIICNKRIRLPNNMKVRYACKSCNWKNDILPDYNGTSSTNTSIFIDYNMGKVNSFSIATEDAQQHSCNYSTNECYSTTTLPFMFTSIGDTTTTTTTTTRS